MMDIHHILFTGKPYLIYYIYISQYCEILFCTALSPSPSLELCDGEDGDEKELEKYLLVNCSELSRVVIGIGTGMMQLMMMVIIPIKSKKNLLLNSAKVVRVVMQDTWEESGQAAMWRRGDNVFGQSSQT